MKKQKYAALIHYLSDCREPVCRLTFDEIESILGFLLPEVSTKYASVFWNNGNQHYALIWLQAGWIVTQYSAAQRFAVFTRNSAEAERCLKGMPVRSEKTAPVNRCNPTKKTDASSMECHELIALAARYFDDLKKDAHARYLSWEHCYTFFQNNRKHPSEGTLDVLCLHLAWYLASWGMLRGGAFLLQKDYLIHMPVVRLLTSDRCANLYNLSIEELTDENVVADIFALSNEISNTYAAETKTSEDDRGSIASDTLISKILLGTIGCTPAYDRYFKAGLRISGVAQQGYTPNSMLGLANYYIQNLAEFEAFRKEISNNRIAYTPMKVLDMCFWQLAYETEQETKKK